MSETKNRSTTTLQKLTPLGLQTRFARYVLMLGLVVMPVLAFIDYSNGFMAAASAKLVTFGFSIFGLVLSRKTEHLALVNMLAAATILLMACVGALTKLNSYSALVWIVFLPFLFFYFTGFRTGLTATSIYMLVYVVSYFTFEQRNGVPPIELNYWIQSIIAYLTATVLALYYRSYSDKFQQELRRVADVDFLTGLLDRAGLSNRLDEEIQRVHRYHTPLSVILVDIDDFKRINDTLGYAAGDQLLVELAGLVAGQLRGIDILSRWGGDELLIVAPGTDLSSAAKLAERLRGTIDVKEFDNVGHVSASFGVARYFSNTGAQVLIDRVDHLMYTAKEFGKNRVVSDEQD
jgi:diguanylate cyclase (GGDEF)-like protein